MTEPKKPKLVPLSEAEAAEQADGVLLGGVPVSSPRPRARRRRVLRISFLLCVVLPTLLGALYYAFIASDRYVSGAGFAVRGMDAGTGGDFIGAVTGLASTGSTTSDSYILLQYLKSRDLVERLEQDFPFRAHYSDEDVDLLSRLDPALDIERVVEYWDHRIHTTFDSTAGIVTFNVEGFTPEGSEQVAALVLGYAKELVNELSSRARQDAVAYAEGEVAQAELRLRLALEALRGFRESEQALDPAGAARIRLELIGELEKQLAEIRARIAALAGTVDEDAPSMRSLLRQAEALEQQIAAQRAAVTTTGAGPEGALTGQLAAYEALEIERSFAEQSYASALSSLEKARAEADRQQRYLAVYSDPALPQYPLYPRRLLNVFLIFAGLGLVWGIGTLTVYAVRDHVT